MGNARIPQAVVLAWVLVLIACGGDGGRGEASGNPSSNPTPAPNPNPNPGPPTSFVNTANLNSPLGSNLAPVVDFTAEYPFANFFKQARSWTSGNSATGQFDDGRSFNLDADGYITSLQANQIGRAVLFTGLPRDTTLNGRRFVLRYDGDGDISYSSGASVLSQSAGRQLIQLGSGGADDQLVLTINLTRTNPANPVRNIRLTPEGGICLSNPLVAVANSGTCGDFRSFEDAATAGEIVFNPEFLDSVKTYAGLRFMDWGRINNSELVQFAERAEPSDAFWSTEKGVPVEAMIALANLMDLDPWINIPHRASDGYVSGVATLIRDRLESGREAYIEYTNESWNGIFTQSEFVQDEGTSRGLHQPENNRFIGGLRFYSLRAQQIFDIFATVFGNQLDARIERVMATQAVNPFLTEIILSFQQAANKTDAFAIAPYFGDTVTETARAALFKAAGVDGVFNWLNSGNPDLGFGTLADLDAAVRDQKSTVAGFNIPLITYEGGQHFLGAGAPQNDAAFNQLLDTVNRDPRMKQAYTTYLSNWRARSDEVFWHYLSVDRWSEFGRWGSKEFPTQARSAAPKFDALQTYIETRPLP